MHCVPRRSRGAWGRVKLFAARLGARTFPGRKGSESRFGEPYYTGNLLPLASGCAILSG
jgi:hypothetical protein